MHLSVTSFPAVLELNPNNGNTTLVPDDTATITEENFMITNATMSVTDGGMTLDFSTDPTRLALSGRYEDQFSHRISYTEPQVNELTKPVSRTVSSWADVPDPTDTVNIWYLFEYTPPVVMTKTVTYTIDASWDEVDVTVPSSPVTTPMTGTFIATQVVNYDIDTNVAEFRKYYPSPL